MRLEERFAFAVGVSIGKAMATTARFVGLDSEEDLANVAALIKGLRAGNTRLAMVLTDARLIDFVDCLPAEVRPDARAVLELLQ